jgi:hypothetical protein
MASSQIYGSVRQSSRRSYTSGGVQTLDLNLGGDLLVSQGLPPRTDLVSKGMSFHAQLNLAQAFTLLITIPTTLANLSLQNPNTVASKICYVIDRFWVKNTTTMASLCSLTPLSQLVTPGTALVANATTVTKTNLSGSTNATTGQFAVETVLTGCLGDKWTHHQSGYITATTNIASVVSVECYGRYIVRPLASFNIAAQESVSGGVAICGLEYHEVMLDLA